MPSSRRPRGRPGDRRQQVREQQRQQVAAARRRRTLIQVGVVAAVAVLAVAIVATAVVLGRRDSPSATPGAVPSVSTSVPVDGATVPLAVDGSAVRLGPADARARVDLWVDYSCPHCAEFEAQNAAALQQLVAQGDVSVSYHNIQIVTDYGTQAGSAAACVAAEAPDRWPTFNTALYANHSAETDGWGPDQFRSFAEQQGVTGPALDCISAERYTGWIASNTDDAAAHGVQGTPTMFLNGQQSPTLTGQQLVDKVNSLAGR